jgi:hypothetical protein
MKKLYYKFMNLFYTPNRFPEYREILTQAKNKGYVFYTLMEVSNLLKRDSLLVKKPFVILRHDIDTDINGALIFSGIEKELGIQASYFFRWKTWNDRIVQKLFGAGHEIGYHYEEIADYALLQRIFKPEKIRKQLPEVRHLFEHRLNTLRKNSNLKLAGIASHGDYLNRFLNIANFKLTEGAEFRVKMSIAYEAYDQELVGFYENHLSDRPFPEQYFPAHPLDFISSGKSFLFLTHPRWWRSNPTINILEDLSSVIKHLYCRFSI